MELTLLGYCGNKTKLKHLNFKTTKNYITLFFGYSPDNFHVGKKFNSIKDPKGNVFPIELELVDVYLGFGYDTSKVIPQGYKSASLMTGSKEDIDFLKKTLEDMKGWKIPKNGTFKVK